MDINDYLKCQKNEFFDFYNDKNKIIVIAIKDVKVLEEIYRDSTIEEYIDDNSYIVNHNNQRYELFIKGTYTSYRKRFQTFLKDIYGLDDSFKLETKINVDHLMNKKRIKGYYIRMILLPDKVNQDWGRSYESIITQIEKNKSKKDIYLLDYTIFLKSIGFSAIKKSDILADDNEISLKAKRIVDEIEKNLGEIGSIKPYIESYYRAEINYIVRGTFYDHDEIDTENYPLRDLENTTTLINIMKHLTVNGCIDFEDGYLYIYRKYEECVATQIINKCLSEEISGITVRLFEKKGIYSLIKVKLDYREKDSGRLIEKLYQLDFDLYPYTKV